MLLNNLTSRDNDPELNYIFYALEFINKEEKYKIKLEENKNTMDKLNLFL